MTDWAAKDRKITASWAINNAVSIVGEEDYPKILEVACKITDMLPVVLEYMTSEKPKEEPKRTAKQYANDIKKTKDLQKLLAFRFANQSILSSFEGADRKMLLKAYEDRKLELLENRS